MFMYNKGNSIRLLTIISLITFLLFIPIVSGTSVYAASAKRITKISRISPTKKSTCSMSKGKSKTFKVKLYPKNLKKTARKTTFTSSNTQVLKVGSVKYSVKGKYTYAYVKVTAKDYGSATVKVKTKSGKTVKWKVNIKYPGGSCGTLVKWALSGKSNNYKLTISGSGSMKDYLYNTDFNYDEELAFGAPWRKYADSITSVVIGNDVSSIGKAAFTNLNKITSISMPNSITSVGNYAFYGCSQLSDVQYSSSLKTIGSYAFAKCPLPATLVLPKSLTTINGHAFSGCSAIKNLTIPGSAEIKYYAFDGTNVTSVRFIGTGKVSNIYQTGTNSLAQNAHYVSNVEIDSGITEFATRACTFYAIKTVNIPNTVTKIGQNAFYQSSLENISIPSSVKSIEAYAFSYCDNLKITFTSGTTSISNDAFKYCRSVTVYAPAGSYAYNFASKQSNLTVIAI